MVVEVLIETFRNVKNWWTCRPGQLHLDPGHAWVLDWWGRSMHPDKLLQLWGGSHHSSLLLLLLLLLDNLHLALLNMLLLLLLLLLLHLHLLLRLTALLNMSEDGTLGKTANVKSLWGTLVLLRRSLGRCWMGIAAAAAASAA